MLAAGKEVLGQEDSSCTVASNASAAAGASGGAGWWGQTGTGARVRGHELVSGVRMLVRAVFTGCGIH